MSHDNKLWTSRNYVRRRMPESDGGMADFKVDYVAWPVRTDRKVRETRRFTLPLGTAFTRQVSTLRSDRPEPLMVGIGIGRKAIGPVDGRLSIDREHGDRDPGRSVDDRRPARRFR